MASARTGAALEIRKLRKKLRQIENLENLDRDLTDEELNKLLKKTKLRENLLKLLAEHGEEEISFTSSTRSDDSEEVISPTAADDGYYGNQDNINRNSFHDSIRDAEVTVIEPEDETNTDLIDVDIEDDNDIVKVSNTTIEAATGKVIQREETDKEATSIEETDLKQPVETSKQSPKKSKKLKKSNPEINETKDNPTNSKLKSTLQKWRYGNYEVVELDGHSDLITAIDTDGEFMVTSSRDTTVKLWSLDTLMELKNYGGHNSTVTCVQLLSEEQSKHICKLLEIDDASRIFISGSYDCSFKIWTTEKSVEALKSVYTFNPVTKVIYHPVAQVIITASDGGKIEMWDILSGENLHSVCPYEEAVTGLKVSGDLIYSSSADGLISVHRIQEGKLIRLFVSENIHSGTDGRSIVNQRYVRGFEVKDGTIYYGDDGTNIKVLDWKKGLVTKLVNHCEDFGVTDSIHCHGNIMVASAYSLDSGDGYINVRFLPDETYVASLKDNDTGRILSISYTEQGNRDIVITAGMQLKVWILNPESSSASTEELIKAKYLPKLAHRHCVDSDVESKADSSEDEDDSGHLRRANSQDSSQGKGWLSWCSVI